MRDSQVEEKACSLHVRDGIKPRCLLQRLCRLSWNQEMTATPGVPGLPWDTRGRNEAAVWNVFAKPTGHGGCYPITETQVSFATQEVE